MKLDTFKFDRTKAMLKTLGLECALFTNFYNVSYLTGYTTFFENGPSPFTEGRAATLFLPDKVILIAEGADGTLEQDGWTLSGESFDGYSYILGTPPLQNFHDAVLRVMKRHAPATRKIGYEATTLATVTAQQLYADYPNLEWVDLPYMSIREVRAVKSDDEIATLMACAKIAEVGQEAVRQLVQEAGKTEIKIYSQAKATMEASIGGRFALQNALHAGKNSQSPFPGMPTDYVTQAGDLIISDMVPYYDGYWGDTCSSFVVGGEDTITAEHRKKRQIAEDAFNIGFEAVKPGVSAGEIDRVVRGYIEKQGYTYPHHTGHGLGVSNQDEPRIIIDATLPLEENMVIVLEPPVYVPDFGGVRLERMFRVTVDGAVLISHNSFDLA